jgi:hypothetical protein
MMKKITLTKKEAIEMLNAATSGEGIDLPGVTWSCLMGAISCDNQLMGIKVGLQKAGNPKNIAEGEKKAKQKEIADAYEKYEELRQELCKKHARKDKTGKAMTQDMPGLPAQYIIADQSAYEAEYKTLETEYQEAVDARKAQVEKCEEELLKEISIELPVISPVDLPKDIKPRHILPFAKLLAKQP